MWNPHEQGALYQNMTQSIKDSGGSIKGVLWYQGCSDCLPDGEGMYSQGMSDTYLYRFGQMIDALRAELGEPVPYITVQLNRVLGQLIDLDKYWGIVRDAQRRAAQVYENVYVVPNTDGTLSDGIHNTAAANMVLGERMARAALCGIYGVEKNYLAMDIKKAARIGSDAVELIFDNVFERIDCFGLHAHELPIELYDESGRAELDSYGINGKSIILKFKRNINGKASVHGAYRMYPGIQMIMDTYSRMPMLSFYDVPVES